MVPGFPTEASGKSGYDDDDDDDEAVTITLDKTEGVWPVGTWGSSWLETQLQVNWWMQ